VYFLRGTLKALRLSSTGLVWAGLLALLVFRFWFAAVLPMTGDEAYFVLWGEHPAGGYYDHPPMVGWWLAALLTISRAEWVLRLPAVLLPLILAAGAWWLVRPHGVERARAAALLVLLAPVDVWNVLITTDTPVILFTMLSALAYVAAQRRASLRWYALAGALLGLAFLGKYFAALLGIAYLAHVLFIRRDAGRWVGFAVLLAASLPAPIYNLWWNSGHCWVNILFNFINRHGNAGLTWQNPLSYVASLIYLATPWVLIALWRHRNAVRQAVQGSVEAGTALWLAVIPCGLFAVMSLTRSVGLHWPVSFIPFFFVLAAIALPQDVLRRLVKWSAGFAALHLLVIIVVAMSPMDTWKKRASYGEIVFAARADELLARLQPYAADYSFAMEGYSTAATMAYHAQRPFAMFGRGSFHGRQDDALTDWREQDGRNVLILRKSQPNKGYYEAFFRDVDFREFELSGVRYYLVLGQGFNYAEYHERILRRIRHRYYRIPDWLPQRSCEFCERYFPAEKVNER
jgi:4-amino-4-deoxy-L-arabinose transferase-like glycosyltransferase